MATASPRGRSRGLSGLAVAAVGTGAYLVYAGLKDIPVLDGARLLLKGGDPATLSRSSGAPYAGTDGGNASAPAAGGQSGSVSAAGLPAGPVPIGETVIVSPDHAAGRFLANIRVHLSYADQTRQLLTAAWNAGYTLTGDGWRSSDQQRAARLRNGYTSDSQPSGSGGRTPTAIPGQSRHERGLAIDFKIFGRSLKKSDAVFAWLKANAGRFGFKNLPSEPWHWSADGH